ncbi:MAG TPA: leucyl aminopeptidase [bacterium]|nr:leucyl aminopeptidase [bacterium]
MKIKAVAGDIAGHKCEALIVNLFEGVKKPGGATGAVDSALGGAISKLIARGEFSGRKGETAALPGGGKLAAGRVIVVGLGKKEKFDAEAARAAAAAGMVRARSMKVRGVGAALTGAGSGGLDPETAACSFAEGAILGLYKFDKYKTKDAKDKTSEVGISELAIVTNDAAAARAAGKGIKLGEILANAANAARDLVNEPPNVLNPAELASRARAMARKRGLKTTVFGKKDIERMKMGALLAVNQGSVNPPAFIVIEYKGDPKSKKTAAFVGKGITFDSGGLSLKPPNSMEDMKSDMSGAAAAIEAMDAISQLAPKINITAIIPATENMPDGGAVRVGDIVRAMNGRAIEILNTDAEGRLILADAICYAVSKGMSPIVDLATLTGACVVALGSVRAGLFSTDDKLAAKVEAAAELAGERVWRMPTDDDYKEFIKSDIADIKNVGNRYAGATTGSLFLEYFTDGTPWAHLDIAGTAYMDKKTGYYVKGGTGTGVRTLVRLALDMARG